MKTPVIQDSLPFLPEVLNAIHSPSTTLAPGLRQMLSWDLRPGFSDFGPCCYRNCGDIDIDLFSSSLVTMYGAICPPLLPSAYHPKDALEQQEVP